MKLIDDKRIHRQPQLAFPRPGERNLWYITRFGDNPKDYRHQIGNLRVMLRQAAFDMVLSTHEDSNQS